MMCKLNGQMDKGGHYDVEMKGWMQKGQALWCGNQRVDGKGGIMVCKLKGGMNTGGYYDVQIKRENG